MSDFMGIQEIGEKRCDESILGRSRALAGVQISQGGKVQKPGETLSEATGNGRNRKVFQGRRPELRDHVLESASDISSQFFQPTGWSRSGFDAGSFDSSW